MIKDKYYKYIHFGRVVNHKSKKTALWICGNNNSNAELGLVEWYSPWRQYCFLPDMGTVFNQTCLNDIGDFLFQVNEEHKNILKERKEQK